MCPSRLCMHAQSSMQAFSESFWLFVSLSDVCLSVCLHVWLTLSAYRSILLSLHACVCMLAFPSICCLPFKNISERVHELCVCVCMRVCVCVHCILAFIKRL